MFVFLHNSACTLYNVYSKIHRCIEFHGLQRRAPHKTLIFNCRINISGVRYTIESGSTVQTVDPSPLKLCAIEEG